MIFPYFQRPKRNYFIAIMSLRVYNIVNVILSMRKNERVYFSKKKNKSSVFGYYIMTVLVDSILMVASLLAGVFVVKNSMIAFVPSEYFSNIIFAAVISTIGAVVINSLYDCVFYKKAILNK